VLLTQARAPLAPIGGKVVLTDEDVLTLRASTIVLRELTVAGTTTNKTTA